MGTIDALDTCERLTRRQKGLAYIATSAICLEFLDYFLIGFIVTFVSTSWQLTFGQSSVILLSSGLGAVVGAVFFGRLADRIGRRPVFLTTITVFTAATAAMAFTPEDASLGWVYLAVLRVVVGFGAGGLYVVDLPMVQEFMPTSKRGRVTGYVTAAVPLGFLVGSLMVWLLSDLIGWRGILLLTGASGLLLLLARFTVPESPRFLLRRRRFEDARKAVGWALQVDPASLPLASSDDDSEHAVDDPAGSSVRELLAYPRSLLLSTVTNLGAQTGVYGIALWAPTLLVMTLGIDPAQAGLYMVFVTMGALAGRLFLSHLSESRGRRFTGALAAFSAAGLVILAAVAGDAYIGGVAVFLVVMIAVYFFAEGGFAVVGPYSAEVWPSRLRATGMGFAYGAGGLGKVVGPLGLGLIVGSDNLVKPDAPTTDLLPAFAYFAVWYLLCGCAFLLLGFETRGKNLETLDAEIEARKRNRSGRDSMSAIRG
ncbi:MFS transporter [Mycolicibacterium smegmatis]|uniref:Sugar transporter, permease protein n=1 Tax=Mycolicibacterium smegmatis (strain ATCC 700084 / mc(2)155) TaxID=246196 RepID=A0QZJ7_MYCS2|nr:sugar transporter, permease protein [Mycolicibacterium smegmatis MC2 155]AIU15780.1 sugar transporter [Mycolicibacterium smegmatis]AIU09155.1 sugar transporter [Mycolicibacterium smegmatis MC2 155]AIU22403.1 sugar transporter [Mycolicibacterium smegmatis]MBE9622060.1 MFS transporter [Mycolicibacterium smegmatis]